MNLTQGSGTTRRGLLSCGTLHKRRGGKKRSESKTYSWASWFAIACDKLIDRCGEVVRRDMDGHSVSQDPRCERTRASIWQHDSHIYDRFSSICPHVLVARNKKWIAGQICPNRHLFFSFSFFLFFLWPASCQNIIETLTSSCPLIITGLWFDESGKSVLLRRTQPDSVWRMEDGNIARHIHHRF